jgi:hypothetical protein
MNAIRSWGALALAVAASACGGGGGTSASLPTPVVVTLVQAGSVLPTAEPTAERARVIRNQAELDIVLARLPAGSIPPAFGTPNFSLVNLLYLEGAGDDDPLSGLSVVSAVRNADGSHAIGAEYCGIAAPVGPHRPFALYSAPLLAGGAVFSQSNATLPNCAGRSRVVATMISSGTPFGRVGTEQHVRVATNSAQWNEILAHVPSGDLPPQFATPDFSQVTMIYLEGPYVFDQSAYVRVVDFLRATPSLHLLYAGFCGTLSDFINPFKDYALYSTPAFVGEIRSEWIYDEPPNCRVPP